MNDYNPYAESVYVRDLLQQAERVCIKVINGSIDGKCCGFGRRFSGTSERPNWARANLPYCFTTVSDAIIIPVNRNYKPIGLTLYSGAYVDYAKFDRWHISGAALRDFNWPRQDSYLFDDSVAPYHGRRELQNYTGLLMRLNRLLWPHPSTAIFAQEPNDD